MKILIIEDEKVLSNTIKQCISKKWDTEQAFDGYEGYVFAKNNIYNAIILDLMLPEMLGNEVLVKLRKENINTPVLILTAKDSIADKLKGFRNGADDYLVKPFNPDELVARLEAIIRRSLSGSYNNDMLQFKRLTLNLSNKKAKIDNNEISLPGKQFDILECLISQQGVIITKEQLFDKIWGFNSDTTTNVVEVYASALRKELKKYGYDKYIKTIRGVGYMLDE